MFTIWTNVAVDLDTLQADAASWPVPALVKVRGTVLGAESFTSYFAGADVTDLPDQCDVPMEDQFDAILYVGPLSAITFVRPSPGRCSDPAHAERLRRLALSPLTQRLVDRAKQNCVPSAGN